MTAPNKTEMTPGEKRKKTIAANKAGARTLGQRLRRRRLEAGLTAQHAAQTVGAEKYTWTLWEVGSRGYPLRRAPEIAAALGIPIASLFTDELVLAEVRISPESLERVKREGRPAADEIAARIAQNLAALLLAQATTPPRDFGPGARARPRRSREQLLAERAAGIAEVDRRHAASAEGRRQARRVA